MFFIIVHIHASYTAHGFSVYIQFDDGFCKYLLYSTARLNIYFLGTNNTPYSYYTYINDY
jgi:hypothetical protein